MWFNDQFNGQGSYTAPDGTQLQGRFQAGKFVEE
jgi:hypothetical protein